MRVMWFRPNDHISQKPTAAIKKTLLSIGHETLLEDVTRPAHGFGFCDIIANVSHGDDDDDDDDAWAFWQQ